MALVGAFSVIVQPVVEPIEHYTALVITGYCVTWVHREFSVKEVASGAVELKSVFTQRTINLSLQFVSRAVSRQQSPDLKSGRPA